MLMPIPALAPPLKPPDVETLEIIDGDAFVEGEEECRLDEGVNVVEADTEVVVDVSPCVGEDEGIEKPASA